MARYLHKIGALTTGIAGAASCLTQTNTGIMVGFMSLFVGGLWYAFSLTDPTPCPRGVRWDDQLDD